jgi:hypothetical protein
MTGDAPAPACTVAAIDAVVDHVRCYGHLGVETGGFLYMAPDSEIVGGVALTGTKGITRQRGLFRISGEAIDALFSWAEDASLYVPIQWHSHAIEAFLSYVDRKSGFSVDGFISAVLPFFKNPPADLSKWSWNIFQEGDWSLVEAPKVVDGAVQIVVFDEDGVRAD